MYLLSWVVFTPLLLLSLISCDSENEKAKIEPPVAKAEGSDLNEKSSSLKGSVLENNKVELKKAMEHALWEKSLDLFDLAYPNFPNTILDSNSCKQFFQALYQKIYLLERSGNIEEASSLLGNLEKCETELNSDQQKLKRRVGLLKEKWNTWPTVLSPHFSVRVEGVEAYNSLPKVLFELEETARTLGEVLNVSLVERIPLRLFKSSPQKVEAWYDGALIVALDWMENDSLETVKILRHELMHAYLTQIRGKEIPRWYHEGMARNFEDLDLELVDYDFKESLKVYKDVDGDFRAKGPSLKKAYILANARIHCWITNKGIDEFINVLNNVSLNLEDEFPYECVGEDILGY